MIKKKILTYLTKNKIKYNKINELKYEILFPTDGGTVETGSTKDILLNFIETQTKINEETKSTKDILLNFIETQTKFNEETRSTKDILLNFIETQTKFNEEQKKFNEEQKKFNESIMNRLDNLVSKNNLVE